MYKNAHVALQFGSHTTRQATVSQQRSLSERGSMLADKGHTLKIDPSYYGQTARQEPKKKKIAQTVCFYLFMEMLLGSHVPSHHSLEVRWRERDVVSQSCLRRPWRNREERRRDSTAQN